MPFRIGFISAQTHTAEYMMHKYWARKPHNVINECIKTLLPNKGVIIDPFCGSGVTLREGALLGNDCLGFDINPTACLISQILVDPPLEETFRTEFERIYHTIYEKFGELYKDSTHHEIKYVSHRIIAKCQCGSILKVSDCIKNNKKLICPHCGKQIHFNLESLVDTEIFNIAYTNNELSSKVTDDDIIYQKKMSSASFDKSVSDKYDYDFPTNKRILAYKGIKTSSFFTNRNFSILCEFANEIENVTDHKVRSCLQLLLTASVAQCSRLIACRNNLKTGGPAWSVPGFWVPREHLETNPFVHIKARFEKFSKALLTLNRKPVSGSVSIYQGDSLELLSSDKFNSCKADLIFLDPPYGDNVPYTEFSSIWNSFLNKQPNYDSDISVSDRIEKSTSWSLYSDKLMKYMELFSTHLSKDGKLLITFNNNDLRAWTALLKALQENHFVCEEVFYQIPAVISSKAQMAINTSYISDIYSVYSYDETNVPSRDLSEIIQDVIKSSNARGGEISSTCADREFILSWLRHNTSYKLLPEKQTIFESIFEVKDKDSLVLKPDMRKETVLLIDVCRRHLELLLKQGPIDIMSAYQKTSSDCCNYGILEFYEFKTLLKEYIIKNNKIIGKPSPTLFEI